GPGGGEVPAAAVGVFVDAVGDSTVRRYPVGPLLAPVRETDPGVEYVTAVRGVRQAGQWGGEFEGDPALAGDADGLVAEPLPRLTVRPQKAPSGLPPGAPPRLGEPCCREVVAGVQQPFAAAHHAYPPGFPVRACRPEPVGEHLQT